MSLTYLYLVKNDSLWVSSYILGVFIDSNLSFKSHPEKKKNLCERIEFNLVQFKFQWESHVYRGYWILLIF